MIDYPKLEKALHHLVQQNNNRKQKAGSTMLEPIDKEAIDESVIQRFETCYDCLWKVVKRYLVEELGVVDVPNSPKPVFRIANENSILPSDVAIWLTYAQARIDTSHDYSENKAVATLALIDRFVDDAQKIQTTMRTKRWE